VERGKLKIISFLYIRHCLELGYLGLKVIKQKYLVFSYLTSLEPEADSRQKNLFKFDLFRLLVKQLFFPFLLSYFAPPPITTLKSIQRSAWTDFILVASAFPVLGAIIFLVII
jgi:hypothetical protein